jgi:tetratricopeptide (TPR) repeat protein
MERKNYIAISGFLLLLSSLLYGNDRQLIYDAYVKNNMPAWQTVIDRLQKQEKMSDETLLALVNYQYGYIGWCIGEDRVTEAESYIALARENLEMLEKKSYNLSMVYAYLSALYGYEIGIAVYRAPFIGPKSIKYADRALELDPANYFGWLQKGNIEYYMPSIFGGSKEDALRYFLKAKVLLEKNSSLLYQNWNYLHLLTIIAQAYSDLKDYNSAKACYETILKIEPEFQWIKDELYPNVLKHFRN